MDNKDFKKWINYGQMRPAAKLLLFLAFLLIGALTLYVAVKDDAPKQFKSDTGEYSQDISKKEIENIRNRDGGLWYEDYILIKGKKYKAKFDENGAIFVDRGAGNWVDISRLSKGKGTVVNKDGKLYFFKDKDKKLYDLNSGDIVADGDEVLRILPNSGVEGYVGDGLIYENGVLKSVDENGIAHEIKDGQTLSVDGKSMKMKDGVLKPLNNAVDSIPEGGYLAKSNPDGSVSYFVKRNGKLQAIDKKDIPEGAEVLFDGTDTKMVNGRLVPLSDYADSISSLDEVDEPTDGDYIVKMMVDGQPKYYKVSDGKLLEVDEKDIPQHALVYYKGKPYIKGANGKLTKFDKKLGVPFIKGGKAYVIGADGKPKLAKDYEMIVANGKKYAVKDGKIVDLSPAEADKMAKYSNVVAIVDGEYRNLNKGAMTKLRNGEIVIRGGLAYRYQDGEFYPLSKDELEDIENKEKSKDDKKKDKDQASDEEEDIDYDDDYLYTNGPLTFDVDIPDSSSDKPTFTPEQLAAQRQQEIQEKLLSSIGQGDDSQYDSQNNQSGKKAWLEKQKKENELGAPIPLESKFTAQEGTVIDATLTTGINSDLAGTITAVVNSPIYDSVTHNFLLIPTGTKLIGAYDSQVSYGQKRVLMAWNRLKFPDGTTMNLAGQQGVDLTGASGLEGLVDNHYYELFKNVALMSLFGAGAQYAAGLGGSGNIDGIQLIAASIGQQIGQTGVQLIQKTLNIQPTITIEAGQRFKILLARDIVFTGPYKSHQPLRFTTNYRSNY